MADAGTLAGMKSRELLCAIVSVAVMSVVLSGIGVAQSAAPGQKPQLGKVCQVGEGVTAPKVLKRVEPEYPEDARKYKVGGTVALLVVVGSDGVPYNIHLARLALGYGLDQNAIDAVSQWRFEPGQKDGQPVAVEVMMEVTFDLQAGQAAVLIEKVPAEMAAAEKVYRIGRGVTPPKLLKNVLPEFSQQARKDKTEGVVQLSFVVGTDGVPREIHVKKGVGHGLDEKAVEAVSQWRFQPAEKDGEPVQVEVSAEVNFHRF
jgi:TonB family protein